MQAPRQRGVCRPSSRSGLHSGASPSSAKTRLAGTVSHWLRLQRDPRFRAAMARARAGLELPPPERLRGSLWAVAMVKDEADVVVETVRHLLAQGVDRVLVADNGSSDGTDVLLHEMRDRRVLVAQDHESGYFQREKMTLLARHAARSGARWVVPFDADEFWLAPEGTLKDYLQRCPEPIAAAAIHNAFPTVSSNVLRLELREHALTKVAFRPHPLAVLSMGNHWVSRPGRTTHDLRILHLPWRSRQQFARKARAGSAALVGTNVSADQAAHWRSLGALSDSQLDQSWQDIVHGVSRADAGWWPSGGPTMAIHRANLSTWPFSDQGRP
jgi:hypothetical protein